MVLSFMLQGADTVMKVCQSLASYIANSTTRFLALMFNSKFHILVGNHLSR